LIRLPEPGRIKPGLSYTQPQAQFSLMEILFALVAHGQHGHRFAIFHFK
jgi:hypothetical protein